MPLPKVITTRRQLKEAVAYIGDRDAFAFDVESTGDQRGVPALNRVTWISLATRGGATVIPMGHPNGYQVLSKATRRKDRGTGKFVQVPAEFSAPPQQLQPGEVFEELAPLFFSERTKIAHNAVFDLVSVTKYFGGQTPPPPYGDSIVAAWLVNENRPALGLKPLVEARYGLRYDKENVGRCVEKHPFGIVADYAWMDAWTTWLLYRHLRPQITAVGLESIWELEMGVLESLLPMQAGGAPVDVTALERLRDDLRQRIVGAEAEVYRAAGQVFNLASNPQRQQILYGPRPAGQGLRPKKATKGGAASTDAQALETYKGKNPVVDTLLEYQELSKIFNTYVEGYLGNAAEGKPSRIYGGKIYPSFAQYGTVTGRFSSHNPNIQNWPRSDTPIGKAIRDIIQPAPGFTLLVADYAQIELRILAHFAGRGALWQGFWDGLDAHVATAAAIFGIAPEDVDKAARQIAKGIAFAILYGAGAQKLADMAHISLRQAAHFMKVHERAFPEIYAYKADILRTAKRRAPVPHIKTLLGRYRRLPDLRSPIEGLRKRAERQVVNSHIQGTNADITKLSMVRFNKARLPGMQMLLTVHDELAVLCPKDIAEEGAAILFDAMAGPEMQLLTVPLTTEVKIVDRWSEAK
jgi:DNA polymerase I-like protein with 3'-5' exonuclease and polymerase domains